MCDTFSLSKDYFEKKHNLFVKNSDRIIGESQPLRLFKGGKHQSGEKIQCTYQEIDQVPNTYTFLGSQPYWIWGVEMGINEWGLAIGNESEGSRVEKDPETGMLAMDLIRLALERASTAREGIEVITSFLEKYGQNVNTFNLWDIRCDNTFMLTDPNEIWVLETAGRHWVARQATDWTSVSNCYTIGEDFDLASENLESYAREKRWLDPGEKFNFSNAYSKNSGEANARWRRVCKMINEADGALSINEVYKILRDHNDGEITEPRFGGCYGGFYTICAHSLDERGAQTTGSLLGWLDDDLGVVVRYAPSSPCCSIYLPVYLNAKLPGAMEKAEEYYDPDSLWWTAERLAWAISIDEARFGENSRNALRALEQEIAIKTSEFEKEAAILMKDGKREEAFDLLGKLTEDSVIKTMALMNKLFMEIQKTVNFAGGLYGMRKETIEAYCERVKMPLCSG